MFMEERAFTLRISLEAAFPEDYAGDADQHEWLREWEGSIKGDLLKAVFVALRRYPGWTARTRNRGMSEQDEIEIVMTKHVEGAADQQGSPPPGGGR